MFVCCCCCFSFKIYFEIVQEKCKEFPHSLHTNSSVVSILPHLLHYLLLSFPGMTSLNSPVYISPKLHCTIQYFRQGNQHWYSTITQSIDLIQMMPAIPTMSLFPFWSRILASTMYCLWLSCVVCLEQFLTLILMCLIVLKSKILFLFLIN